MSLFDQIPLLPSLPNANCREIEDPDVFFPVSKEEEARSLEVTSIICGNCRDRKECLEFALSEQIPYGIWAGKTPEQRKILRPAKGRAKGMPKVAHKIRTLDQAGRSPKQIAEILGCAPSYVAKVLSRKDRN